MKNNLLFIIILFCSSCGSTMVVQGIEVHSPTRSIQKRDVYISGAAAIAGFVLVDRFIKPEQKEKLQKKLNLKL